MKSKERMAKYVDKARGSGTSIRKLWRVTNGVILSIMMDPTGLFCVLEKK